MPSIARAASLLIPLALVTACVGDDKDGDSEATVATSNISTGSTGGSMSSTSTMGTLTTLTAATTETTADETTGAPEGFEGIDVLFVIDNSGSMAEEQAEVVASLSALLDPLTAAGHSVRIGVTTTDNGNPRCPKADTTPEAGALVSASCIDRLASGDFVFKGVDPPFDAAYTCTDACSLSSAELAMTGPWIEVEGETTNLGPGISATAALRCLLPQGISGCGFESPLESMYKGIARAGADGDPQFGFLRDGAVLAVVILTDEADCSHSEPHKSIFIDNKVFWNDPSDPIPTSAVCWRAGVACSGSGPTYASCVAENFNEAGSPGVSDADAVLQPLSRYLDQLTALRDLKAGVFGPAGVQVHVIGGVPAGYTGPADLLFEDASDPNYQGDFGIGPACTHAGGGAVPLVRTREVAEALAGGAGTRAYSICEAQSGNLQRIAEAILAAVP